MSSKRILFLSQPSAVTRIFPQLRGADIEASLAENAKGALSFVASSNPHYIITSPNLPGYKAEEILSEIKNNDSFPRVIIVSEHGTADEARHFMELGAYDFWRGIIDIDKLKALPIHFDNQKKSHKKSNIPKIIGSSRAMKKALSLARQVAPSKATVLINGESGTGKEMFAKNLHGWSNRANMPFIAINCAALPEHLLESELFGHEKGSFTGAIGKKVGKFELAHGGTLLLDEISEMDLALQAKLLRALQEGEIDRVGGVETIKVDVRVIATTNRDLDFWVKEGKFRQDLYFRLNVIPLRLPSLSERGDDVYELANFFTNHYTNEYQLPKAIFSEEALTWLKEYDFPGNVRELQNLMERAVLLAGGKNIKSAHFLIDEDNWPLFEDEEENFDNDITDSPTENNVTNNFLEQLQGNENCDLESVQSEISNQTKDENETIENEKNKNDSNGDFAGALMPLHEVERLMIKKGLAATQGNRTQAAEILGISVRTLRNKLNEYRELGLDVE